MSNQKIELSKLSIEQLHVVKQQFDQELQHFQQSLQALIVAKSKFVECINDIKTISQDSNDEQDILIPASPSLYIPGKITNKNNKKLSSTLVSLLYEMDWQDLKSHYHGLFFLFFLIFAFVLNFIGV